MIIVIALTPVNVRSGSRSSQLLHTLPNDMLTRVPFFNTLANGAAAAAINPQANFINHLAATIITTSATSSLHNSAPTTPRSSFNSKSKTSLLNRTPEPPPAPILGPLSSSLSPVKPNQGTAPMDLENDENETPTTNPLAPNVGSTASKMSTDKSAINMSNGMYLNSLLAGQMPGINPAFMFFPGANSSGNQTGSNNLLDPSTMMAAAMQQMHQYAGYGNATLTEANAATISGEINKMSQGINAETPSVPPKDIIKTNSCMLFPPNLSAPPPTIRDRPPGCRTVFVGGLPEQITEDTLREIFESCGEISTLRMSKKNFCHIRFRNEESVGRAISFSGYRLRLNAASSDQSAITFARLHVDYAQARDDQYDYQCKQRQLQREQRHRERMSLDRLRSQSPPPTPHYSDHEASIVADSLRSNDTFVKGVQTMTNWLERGDCTKRNANVFYSMIQSTHAHVRRLTADKQALEEDLRKARESFRKQMSSMSSQFTQIEKVFNAASHKKVWDHFTKAQRKNIDQWKKLATELRCIQVEDDVMEMSDDDRDFQSSSHSKRKRYDSDNLKEENDSLRCQLEAMRNEMNLERTDLKHNSDFREKQMKVLQETIRNMQTQLLQTKMREQKDSKTIEQLEKNLKEAAVKQLLLNTKIREITAKLRDRENNQHCTELEEATKRHDNSQIMENDSLRCQLETMRNEMSLERTDLRHNNDVRENQMKVLQETLRNMQTELHQTKMREQKDSKTIAQLEKRLKEAAVKQLLLQTKIHVTTAKLKDQENQDSTELGEDTKLQDNSQIIDISADKLELNHNKETIKENELNAAEREKPTDLESSLGMKSEENNPPLKPQIKENLKHSPLPLDDAKIIALATAYLLVLPMGSSTQSLCSYIKNITKKELQEKHLNLTLLKYTGLFKTSSKILETQDETINHTMVQWIFCGLTATLT